MVMDFPVNKIPSGCPSLGVNMAMALTIGALSIYARPPFAAPRKVSLQSHPFFPHISQSLGDGSQIRFWLDKWAANQPLNVLFLRIFNLFTKNPMSSLISSLFPNQISILGEIFVILKLRLSSLLPLLNPLHLHPSKSNTTLCPPPPWYDLSLFFFLSFIASSLPSHHLVRLCPSQNPKFPLNNCLVKSSYPRPISTAASQFGLLPHICFLWVANLDQTTISSYTYPFNWKLWKKLFNLVNLGWAVPNSIHSLISQ